MYHEPVDEPTAVHNLEHGYALLYYRPDDPTVGPEIVAMLEGLAREFDKVVVATPDAEAVARSFVLRFAGTDVAPEPPGP